MQFFIFFLIKYILIPFSSLSQDYKKNNYNFIIKNLLSPHFLNFFQNMSKSQSDRPKNIIIIPFRFYKGNIEVLLKTHITKSKAFISEISGPMVSNDPSPIFAGARIFLTEFLKMNYKLDEKVSHFFFYIKLFFTFFPEYQLGFS